MQPVGTNIIVRPLYDPDKVESGLSPGAPALYMPDSGKNPMSQQGIVLAVGPQQQAIHVGDHVLYHPFVEVPFRHNGKEYLMVPQRYIAGWLNSEGELFPMPTDVVVKPDFAPAGRPELLKSGLWIPRQVFDTEVPCTGKVLRIGCSVRTVTEGQRVLFPPEVGNEIGLREVFYTIPEKEILAVLETALPVTVMVTSAQWSSHGQRGN